MSDSIGYWEGSGTFDFDKWKAEVEKITPPIPGHMDYHWHHYVIDEPYLCGRFAVEMREKEAANLRRKARAERFDRLWRWVAFTVFLLLAFAATLHAQEPNAVLYIERMEPTPAMAVMYHEVEACVHEKGDFKRVSWYSTANPWSGSRGKTWGLWRAGRFGWTSIIAVEADTAILRHEMLHDVMRRNGFEANRAGADSLDNTPEHPSPPFGDCARRFFPTDYKPWGRQ